MSESDFPEPPVEVESINSTTLKERIDAGEDIVILDTRAESEYEEWHIDGQSVGTLNVPYFEFLAGEPDESVFENIPDDKTIVVVCAKGKSSRYVGGILEDRGYDVEHLKSGMNGWASIYEYEELDTSGDVTIAQYRRPSSGCLAYLIVSDGEAAVIDPLRAFVDTYEADARILGADITYAIDTHIHADHVSGVRHLAEATRAATVLPRPSVERGVEYDVDEAVADGDELTVGDTTIEVIHTPGHTTGMTSYRVNDILFTGDGLFTESVARPDLEEGDKGAADAARQLHETLQERILTLPDGTVVAPGHFSDAAEPNDDGTYTATLGELKESMEPLSMPREEFVEFILSDMPPRPANYEEIIETNLGQRSLGDDEAFRLELGPNNCAASQDALTGD